MRTKLFFLSFLYSIQLFAQIPTTSLDSEYKFVGGSLNDTFGTAENLTKTGSAATFTTDRLGVTNDAINLSGDYLSRIPLQNATSLSMSFWMKTGTNDTNQRIVLEQSQRVNVANSSSDRGWYVYLRNGIIVFSCNYLWRWTANGGANVYTGHTGWWDCTSNTNVADNNWHHVAITVTGRSYYSYSGTPHWAFENIYKIYVDNVLKNTITRTYDATAATGGNGTSSPDFLPVNNVGIGGNSYNNLTATNEYSNEIDDIRFYKTTLTAANVASLYQESGYLSRNDFNSFSDFTIYPNPSNSVLSVSSTEKIETIELISIEGKKIKTVSGSLADISELSNGVYLLQVKTIDGKTGVQKIFKN